MPEISRFLGIVITMYFNDHMPPHFHAEYNNQEAAFEIKTLSKSAGYLPPRITGFVIEWASQHQKELMDNWNLLNSQGTFEKIPPFVFMLHVETAKYLENYKMSVIFNDGSSHIVDFEKTIINDHRPIISALKDISVFKDFSIQNHTISWANGLDFAPEFIKDCSIKQIVETA